MLLLLLLLSVQYVFCDGVRPKHYRLDSLTTNNKP